LSMAWNEFVANVYTVKANRETVKRVLARMTHRQLAGAFDRWHEQTTKSRDQRNKCIQIIQKMLHRMLALAFDGFATTVEEMRARRVALEQTQQQLNAEIERRKQQCHRVVQRLLQRQLFMAWNEFVENICAVKANRETVKRVLARMTHRQLAGAFDCYSTHVETVREQRERVQRTMARWRTPGVKRAFDHWIDYMDIVLEEREQEAKRLLMTKAQEAEATGVSLAQQEANRRLEMCKRTVKRMLQHHLSMAWNEFVANVYTVKANRETVERVLTRMTHRQLAGAFDCYAGHVADVRGQRERVQRTMARWRTPGVKRAFDHWIDYTDINLAERAEEAKELVKQELLKEKEELEFARSSDLVHVELKLSNEVQRRVDQCKRVVKRMLHHQLMLAWDAFVDSVMTVRCNRETMRRVLARMTHRQVTHLLGCINRISSRDINRIFLLRCGVLSVWYFCRQVLILHVCAALWCLRLLFHARTKCARAARARCKDDCSLAKTRTPAWVGIVAGIHGCQGAGEAR
jgi:hypothetical protein